MNKTLVTAFCILLGLILVFGVVYYAATDFDRDYEKYKVRYSRSECLNSSHCPEEFKEQYRNPQPVSTKQLMGALDGNE